MNLAKRVEKGADRLCDEEEANETEPIVRNGSSYVRKTTEDDIKTNHSTEKYQAQTTKTETRVEGQMMSRHEDVTVGSDEGRRRDSDNSLRSNTNI